MSEDEPRVRFPVRCPVCRKEVVAEYRTVDIVGALINGRPIHLYAACHDTGWIASYVELQDAEGHIVHGVGMDPSIVTASLKAILSAVQRMMAKG